MASLKLCHWSTPKLALCFVHFLFFLIPLSIAVGYLAVADCFVDIEWDVLDPPHITENGVLPGHCESMEKTAKTELVPDFTLGLGWVRGGGKGTKLSIGKWRLGKQVACWYWLYSLFGQNILEQRTAGCQTTTWALLKTKRGLCRSSWSFIADARGIETLHSQIRISIRKHLREIRWGMTGRNASDLQGSYNMELCT